MILITQLVITQWSLSLRTYVLLIRIIKCLRLHIKQDQEKQTIWAETTMMLDLIEKTVMIVA